jgi:D-sedoheptulose 7-phosphate isomerase
VTDAEAVRAALIAAARRHEDAAGTAADDVARAADVVRRALGGGRKVLVFGNGGSAADAQHFACELVGRFARDRRGWPVIALTADSAVTTSVANDLGYDAVFARQVEAFGVAGDVAMAITTSGVSANVNRALVLARARGLTTIGLTGRDGGETAALVDVHVNVPASTSPEVQEVQRTMLHAICALVEASLAGPRPDER